MAAKHWLQSVGYRISAVTEYPLLVIGYILTADLPSLVEIGWKSVPMNHMSVVLLPPAATRKVTSSIWSVCVSVSTRRAI